MQELLTVLVTWLSINFGLAATAELPAVTLASAAQMVELRHERSGEALPHQAAGAAASEHEMGFHAVYDDKTRTIYLHEGWSGATPVETSILVHELVHHLQNLEERKYDCPEAREKPAYRAQAQWLELFGTTLDEKFGLDPMTLLVRTNCIH